MDPCWECVKILSRKLFGRSHGKPSTSIELSVNLGKLFFIHEYHGVRVRCPKVHSVVKCMFFRCSSSMNIMVS